MSEQNRYMPVAIEQVDDSQIKKIIAELLLHLKADLWINIKTKSVSVRFYGDEE